MDQIKTTKNSNNLTKEKTLEVVKTISLHLTKITVKFHIENESDLPVEIKRKKMESQHNMPLGTGVELVFGLHQDCNNSNGYLAIFHTKISFSAQTQILS